MLNFNKIIFLVISFSVILLFSLNNFAQTVREKSPNYFGIQFKPIYPEDFLSKSVIKLSNDTLEGIFSQQRGYSFGAVTRIGITPLINIETGINQTKRNYKINFSHLDSNVNSIADLSINSYDIPLNLLIYIQLSKKIFSNVSLGTSIVNFPSNVGVKTNEGNHVFMAEARRNKFFSFDLNANIGFEYRSKKYGFFYLGASGKIPVNPIYNIAVVYIYGNAVKQISSGSIIGGYLSFDIRYFFPIISKKGTQILQGPIQQ